ncbi:hypothetical protein ACFXJ5_31400 [Streptomyces sp. NPDC059373]
MRTPADQPAGQIMAAVEAQTVTVPGSEAAGDIVPGLVGTLQVILAPREALESPEPAADDLGDPDQRPVLILTPAVRGRTRIQHRLPARPEAMIHLAMTDLMARRLTGEATVSWGEPTSRDQTPPAG